MLLTIRYRRISIEENIISDIVDRLIENNRKTYVLMFSHPSKEKFQKEVGSLSISFRKSDKIIGSLNLPDGCVVSIRYFVFG